MLVVRAWIEETLEEKSLRARITETLDVTTPTKVERAAASREDVVRVVEEWLTELEGT